MVWNSLKSPVSLSDSHTLKQQDFQDFTFSDTATSGLPRFYISATPQHQDFQGFTSDTPQHQDFQGFTSDILHHQDFQGFTSDTLHHQDFQGFTSDTLHHQDFQDFTFPNSLISENSLRNTWSTLLVRIFCLLSLWQTDRVDLPTLQFLLARSKVMGPLTVWCCVTQYYQTHFFLNQCGNKQEKIAFFFFFFF